MSWSGRGRSLACQDFLALLLRLIQALECNCPGNRPKTTSFNKFTLLAFLDELRKKLLQDDLALGCRVTQRVCVAMALDEDARRATEHSFEARAPRLEGYPERSPFSERPAAAHA